MLNRDYRGMNPGGDTLHTVQGWIMGCAERARDPDLSGPPTRHRPFVNQTCRHCGTAWRILNGPRRLPARRVRVRARRRVAPPP